MTIIIKSNEVSTRNMGNLFGLSKTDYLLLLDFNLGEYRTKSGGVITKTTLADAISLSRASKATYINSSNEIKEAAINELRIQYDKDTGKQGLLIESGFTELLANPYAPITQTAQVTIASFVDLVVLTVKGSGSAVVSGAVTANGGSTLTATENSPVSFLPNAVGTTPVTITVTGQLEVFSLKAKYVQSLSFAPVGQTVVAIDSCSLSSAMFNATIANRKECTILMRLVENKKTNISALGASTNTSNNIFALRNTASNKAGIYVYRDTGINSVYNARFLLSDTTIVKSVNKIVNDSVREHTYALTYDNYGADAILARNGEATVSDGAYDLRPDKLLLGSQTDWNFSANLNGIITSLVIYPYKMSYEEMVNLTAI